MHFVSLEFLVLVVVVLVLYYSARRRVQNLVLLVASYVFYGWWDWRFLSLILISTMVDFLCGFYLDQVKHPDYSQARRRLILSASVVANLGLLGVFKYADFFIGSLVSAAARLGITLDVPLLGLVLPVGISFYTFQTMSYTFDVYRGKISSTDSLPEFMLYVSFFPQLVAGPIERAAHLLPQVLGERQKRWRNVAGGAQLMLVGFFKKMVIADNMALIANWVFALREPGGFEVLVATYAFALQIYCDFSGYTDIARGTARMLGFEICENFRLPYLAVNPGDFWRRWHISLSSWLRDYLYIPLGGNRRGAVRTYFNLALVMLLGGLWHGAAWHFVVWGAFHGFLLIVYRLAAQARGGERPLPHWGWAFWLQVVFFFHLTCAGWLIFRAESVGHIFKLSRALIDLSSWQMAPMLDILKVGLALIGLFAFQAYQHRSGKMEVWTDWPVWVQAPFYLVLFYGIVFLGSVQTNAFIYFQF